MLLTEACQGPKFKVRLSNWSEGVYIDETHTVRYPTGTFYRDITVADALRNDWELIKEKPTVPKPPKGYRIIEDGETIPKICKGYFGGKWKDQEITISTTAGECIRKNIFYCACIINVEEKTNSPIVFVEHNGEFVNKESLK